MNVQQRNDNIRFVDFLTGIATMAAVKKSAASRPKKIL